MGNCSNASKNCVVVLYRKVLLESSANLVMLNAIEVSIFVHWKNLRKRTKCANHLFSENHTHTIAICWKSGCLCWEFTRTRPSKKNSFSLKEAVAKKLCSANMTSWLWFENWFDNERRCLGQDSLKADKKTRITQSFRAT